MSDLCNTFQMGEKLPITAAFLGAYSVPTEFNFVIAHKRGGLLAEWANGVNPSFWHVPQCARLEDILSDSRRRNAPQQLIIDRLPVVIYGELLRNRVSLFCRACGKSITLPTDYKEPER